jgi:hypothetical protein
MISPEQAAFNYPNPPREGLPGFFTIAQDGEPRCVIVHGADAPGPVQAAASQLAQYLHLVTGARFRVSDDSASMPDGMGAIHVGETAVSAGEPLDLPDVRYGDDVLPNVHGYVIRTPDPRTLTIRGRTTEAVRYGVIALLERYAGVRQFWLGRPGSLGDVIPSRPTLRVPEVEWRDWPYFISRSMSMHPLLPGGGNALDFFRRGGTLPCSENYYRLMPPEKYGETHPEYFPLIGETRRVPPPSSYSSRWQPCVSNPEVVQVMADAVLAYFRDNPDALGMNVSVNDGHGDCTCAGCRAMDAPGADYSRRTGMSDRYVKFTNQVAEKVAREFPSKMIVFLAYSATRQPPTTVQLHPNILPVLTVSSTFDAWDQWMPSGARRMGLYLHHNGKSHFVLPKLDTRQVARRIRYLVASGRARVLYKEMHLHWPVSGSVAYVTSRLAWDPRRDVDELLDEYYAGLYGPAGAAMREHHDAIEAGYERWLREQGVPHWFAPDASATTHAGSSEQFRVLNPEEAARAAAALARATATPGLDDRQQERLALVQAMFRLQALGVRRYWTDVRLATEPVHSEVDAKRVVADARDVVAVSRAMRAYIETTLEQPPLDRYELFRQNRPLTISYHSMKTGEPGPDSVAAIHAGVRAAADYLREAFGTERAGDWWRAQRKDESEPLLLTAFESGEDRARGIEPANLLTDPGYEEVGAKLAPDERDLDADVALDPGHIGGLHIWHADRTPFRVALTRSEPRSGDWSLMLEHLVRARLGRSVPAEPGARYRAGLWIRHNDAPGKYVVVISAAMPDGGLPTPLVTMPVPERPDQWQEIATDVVAPAEARRMNVQLLIDSQAQDARCWVDDFFLGKYPER